MTRGSSRPASGCRANSRASLARAPAAPASPPPRKRSRCPPPAPPRARRRGERAGAPRTPTRLQALELLGQRTLARGQLTQPLHRLSARAHHRQQPLRIAVHPLLLLGHAGELFDRLLEARSRLRAG